MGSLSEKHSSFNMLKSPNNLKTLHCSILNKSITDLTSISKDSILPKKKHKRSQNRTLAKRLKGKRSQNMAGMLSSLLQYTVAPMLLLLLLSPLTNGQTSKFDKHLLLSKYLN